MVYMMLGTGFEVTEAMVPLVMMRRAGIEVCTVGINGKTVYGSRDVGIVADIELGEMDLTKLEGIILPGGMPGTINLENNENVQRAIDFCFENEKLISAICAAPSILGHKNLLKGKEAISYPGFEKDLYGAEISDKAVAVSGNIITAKGAGVAVDFGLEIVAYLKDRELSDKIKEQIQCI